MRRCQFGAQGGDGGQFAGAVKVRAIQREQQALYFSDTGVFRFAGHGQLGKFPRLPQALREQAALGFAGQLGPAMPLPGFHIGPGGTKDGGAVIGHGLLPR